MKPLFGSAVDPLAVGTHSRFDGNPHPLYDSGAEEATDTADDAESEDAESEDAETVAAEETEEDSEEAEEPVEATAERAEKESAEEESAASTEEPADTEDTEEPQSGLRNRRPTGKGSHRMRRRTRGGVALEE